jgi:putative DNA primase/helicase
VSWDGVPRIATVFLTYAASFGPEAYLREAARVFFLSLANRILDPGCKVDTMLILESDQGYFKSSFLGVIGGEFYMDSPLDLQSKDAAELLQGRWLVEVAELSTFKSSDINSMKSFISRNCDSYRAPYARKSETRPRTCVIAGTTNESVYLTDATGNRRFAPIRLVRPIDLASFEADLPQILAEAFARVREGEEHWTSNPALIELQRAQQDSRRVSDPWEEKITFELGRREIGKSKPIDSISAHDLFAILGVDAGRLDKSAATRLGIIMRLLKFERRRRGGVTEYVRGSSANNTSPPLPPVSSSSREPSILECASHNVERLFDRTPRLATLAAVPGADDLATSEKSEDRA